jgi:hypothetical protein
MLNKIRILQQCRAPSAVLFPHARALSKSTRVSEMHLKTKFTNNDGIPAAFKTSLTDYYVSGWVKLNCSVSDRQTHRQRYKANKRDPLIAEAFFRR